MVDGHDLLRMSRSERVNYQRSVVGFVWQQASRNLLPYLTAAENIAMVLAVARTANRQGRARELLELLGVGHCADRHPAEMSGGEQQRTAIAVALANRPSVLLADEPTGELDETSTADVLEAIRRVNAELGVTTVIVTHDPSVAAHVRRTIHIRDGRIATETMRRNEIGPDGRSVRIAEEFAVVDRLGRMQLPQEAALNLGLAGRVRLAEQPDHLRRLAAGQRLGGIVMTDDLFPDRRDRSGMRPYLPEFRAEPFPSKLTAPGPDRRCGRADRSARRRAGVVRAWTDQVLRPGRRPGAGVRRDRPGRPAG